MQLPRSCKEARKQGSKYYYTGRPCKYNHDSKRMTSDRRCVQCYKERNTSNCAAYRKRNREHYREYQREYQREYRKDPSTLEIRDKIQERYRKKKHKSERTLFDRTIRAIARIGKAILSR